HVPNIVTGIYTIGQRVIVSDVQESLFWVRYRRNENQLIIFADDTYPRWVTTACLLDYDTMASADKFGNISIVSTIIPRFLLDGTTISEEEHVFLLLLVSVVIALS
ncbi:Splicing factor 3B subunit 3, partial [Characodon lateralis]|nr:Splicing factor 3B subunit 3 [Characodon lateralis]